MSTSTLSAPDAAPPAEGARYVSVFADLLPDELVAARRARQRIREVVTALAALAVVLVGWFGIALLRTANANGHLTKAEARSGALQREVQSFAPLITAQTQSAAIAATLSRLMGGDLQWTELIDTLHRIARSGVAIESVTAAMNSGPAGAAATGGLAVLNQTGKQQVGTLTISGGAPDKNSVAAYVDSLTRVHGLAAPLPASVTGEPGHLTFSVSVIITSDALGGRFRPAPAADQGGR